MLPVTVDGDGVFEPFGHCQSKALLKRTAFAMVDRQSDSYGFRHSCQDISSLVGRTVIYYNDIAGQGQYITNHLPERFPVVICRDNDTASEISYLLADFLVGLHLLWYGFWQIRQK